MIKKKIQLLYKVWKHLSWLGSYSLCPSARLGFPPRAQNFPDWAAQPDAPLPDREDHLGREHRADRVLLGRRCVPIAVHVQGPASAPVRSRVWAFHSERVLTQLQLKLYHFDLFLFFLNKYCHYRISDCQHVLNPHLLVDLSRLPCSAQVKPPVSDPPRLPAEKLQPLSPGVHLWDQTRHRRCGVANETMVKCLSF